MVVEDDVPLLDLAFQPVEEPAYVPGEGADVHRGRLGLAELAALRVEDAGAEILGLADDRRVAHAEENTGHLLRDRVEGAAKHAQGNRVDLDAGARGWARLASDLVLENRHVASSLPIGR